MYREYKVYKDFKDPPELQVSVVYRDLLGRKVSREYKESKDPLE